MLSLTNVLNISRPIVRNFVVIAKTKQPEKQPIQLEYTLEYAISKKYNEMQKHFNSKETTLQLITHISRNELRKIIEEKQ